MTNLNDEGTIKYWADFDSESFVALATEKWPVVIPLGYGPDELRALWDATLAKIPSVIEGALTDDSTLHYAAAIWSNGYMEGIYTLAVNRGAEEEASEVG